jgi:multimeric flavodoxin WrbA
MVLAPFIDGLRENGANVDLVYASKLKVKPCSCGQLSCWYQTPGECVFKDSMVELYSKLKQTHALVFASPVYSPLPGDLQNIINRMVALLDPKLIFREGRTRARFRQNVNIKRVVLVAAGGWWEKENVNLLQHVIEEFAKNASVQFSGTLFRPHAYAMQTPDGVTSDGKKVLSALKKAAKELITLGEFNQKTMDDISRPLLPREIYEEYLG